MKVQSHFFLPDLVVLFSAVIEERERKGRKRKEMASNKQTGIREDRLHEEDRIGRPRN